MSRLIGERINALVGDIVQRGNAQARSDSQSLAYRVRLIEEAVLDLRDMLMQQAETSRREVK